MAAMHSTNGANKNRRVGAFKHIPPCTRPENAPDIRCFVMRADGQDVSRRIFPRYSRGEWNSAGSGHGNIDNHQIRIQQNGLLESLAPVLGFPNYTNVGIRRQNRNQAAPYNGVIVYDQNVYGSGRTDVLSGWLHIANLHHLTPRIRISPSSCASVLSA